MMILIRLVIFRWIMGIELHSPVFMISLDSYNTVFAIIGRE